MNIPEALLFVLRDMLWSGVAALGFAMLFNVPVRTLAACAIGGAIGHIIRTLLMKWGVSIETATLAGATVVGFLGEMFARRWLAPASVFTVPAVIPMVPGTFAYRTMIGLLALSEASATGASADLLLLMDVAVHASKTMLILLALAMGIAAPALLALRRPPPT